MRSRLFVAAASTAALTLAAAATAAPDSAPAPMRWQSAIRITTPGLSTCPAEGEPEVTATSAGVWVAYNDDHQCNYNPQKTRAIELQRVAWHATAPTFYDLKPPAGEIPDSDPDLAPAADGGVWLSALWLDASGATVPRVAHVTPSGRLTTLPTPDASGASAFDDKPFLAVDNSRGSRYRGRVYLAWDNFSDFSVRVRAWDGHRWLREVSVQSGTGSPDVAVGPHGELAVVTEEGSGHGAMLRVSRDGGQSFGRAITVFTGLEPGVLDPSCPFDSSVGVRQRAIMSPRVIFDRAGDLHVVAALGNRLQGSTNATDFPGVSSGLATIGHALVRGNRVVARTAVTAPSADQQWAPAIAPLPKGGVAVEWLQTTGSGRASYDSWSAVLGKGANRFTSPQRLSDASSTFPAAMEAADNSSCYGVGDYIGLASTPTGVAAVWPTTTGDVPGLDSDVMLRLGIGG